MSELRVDNIVDMGGSGAPQLRKGASVTGISTITQAVVGNATINAGGINATGIVTSSGNKFVGDLASGNITAGVMTATSSVVASNITINSGGVNASGIVSATSYTGSGANLTGIGLSIAPLMYNPDISDGQVPFGTGIGLTFNQRVFAGTGNVTLSLASVGSTVVENFGVGSSVTYNNDADPPNITINPTADLAMNTVYAISYPSGAFIKNTGAGSSFVGTAYTFSTLPVNNKLFSWGENEYGALGQNSATDRSSPTQVPGATWSKITTINGTVRSGGFAVKHDGTLWAWGYSNYGVLGQSSLLNLSSPVQVGADATWSVPLKGCHTNQSVGAVKTDGTLWTWGKNPSGVLGHNNETDYSSPIQIGSGTDWSHGISSTYVLAAIKTDNTLWMCGTNQSGVLGQNESHDAGTGKYSSPVQVPGTTWTAASCGETNTLATKSDGTLWAWGTNAFGNLGQNNTTD